jgi:hypothetical protein
VDNFTRNWLRKRANDSGGRVPDANLAAAATRALGWDAPVPVERGEVTVSRGWATLRGEVQWAYQRHRR